MSLTSHLKDHSSPIREFLRNQFPNTRSFLADARKQIREAHTIRPTADVPWSAIGIALDYRIRYYFAVTPYQEFVAYGGARRLTDAGTQALTDVQLAAKWAGDAIAVFDTNTKKQIATYLPEYFGASMVSAQAAKFSDEILEIAKKVAEEKVDVLPDDFLPLADEYIDFFHRLEALTKGNPPIARRLSIAEEDELNRYCFVLALMEQVFRTGRLDFVLRPGEFSDADSLIGLAESNCLDDLRELSWEFYDRFNRLLPLPHAVNPNFDGSRDIGGADADMIVDGVLLDIKTTIKREIGSDWIWQLLGYVLLDYSDHYHMNGVGFYMARQGMLIKWDLEETLRGLCAGEPPTIEELRARFEELVRKTSPIVKSRAHFEELVQRTRHSVDNKGTQ